MCHQDLLRIRELNPLTGGRLLQDTSGYVGVLQVQGTTKDFGDATNDQRFKGFICLLCINQQFRHTGILVQGSAI